MLVQGVTVPADSRAKIKFKILAEEGLQKSQRTEY